MCKSKIIITACLLISIQQPSLTSNKKGIKAAYGLMLGMLCCADICLAMSMLSTKDDDTSNSKTLFASIFYLTNLSFITDQCYPFINNKCYVSNTESRDYLHTKKMLIFTLFYSCVIGLSSSMFASQDNNEYVVPKEAIASTNLLSCILFIIDKFSKPCYKECYPNNNLETIRENLEIGISPSSYNSDNNSCNSE